MQLLFILWKFLLLAKLKAYGVAKPGIALMRNYLTGRSQRVKMAPMLLPGYGYED